MPDTLRKPTPADESFFKEVEEQLSTYLVAFVEIYREENIERARSVGSGTFARIGNHRGILTAAHVIDRLPSKGLVYLARVDLRHPQRTSIEMSSTHRVIIGSSPFSHLGPDLAFLILSPEPAGSLEAASNFYTIDPTVLPSKIPADTEGIDAIAGIIEEQTKHNSDPNETKPATFFKPRLEIGLETARETEGGYDYVSLTPAYDDAAHAPRSYGGMSGGPWWRVTSKVHSDGSRHLDKKWIRGVAFYQQEPDSGIRTLRCHGQTSIYQELRDKVLGQSR